MSTNETRKPVDPNAPSERYLFETCFDSDRMASQDEPPEPTFTAEDLENAREAAYAEGEATGRQDAVNSIEKQLLNGLGRLVEQMGALSDDQMRFQQDLTERSVELALKATRKMFPALAQRDGLVEIDALLKNCLLEAKEEPRIMVWVSDDLAEPYRERIDALAAAAGFRGAVTVLPDDTFGPADCRVEWTDGGAERIAAQMWREFDAATQRIFSDSLDDDDGERGRNAVPEQPDEATPVAPGPEPAMTIPDTAEIVNGHAGGPMPEPADPIAAPMPAPMPEAIEAPVDEPAGELSSVQAGEQAEAQTDEPVADAVIEPVVEPAEESAEESAELPTPPDDAADGPGASPDADPPQQPATAS